MRKVDGTSEITGGGMTTTGDLAAVIVDSNGDLVRGWTSSETAKYNGDALPLLGVAPTIYTDPASQDIATGDTATLQVVPQGSAPFSYQWYKNGTLIQDATARTYTTGALDSSNDGDAYTVTVTNKYGSVTSSAATLTVAASASPSITTQPVSGEATEGRSVTFSVEADGSDAKAYQWQLDDGSGWADIEGAVSSQYTTPATALSESGNDYRVIVTNDYGTITSSAATLTVSSAVSVSEDWTGTDGDPWPSQWTEQDNGDPLAVNISSNQGHMGSTGMSMMYINNAEAAFVDQTVKLDIHGGTAAKAGLFARRSDSDSDTYYMARSGIASGGGGDSVRIYKVIDGTQTQLGMINDNITVGVWMMRFVVETNDKGLTDLKLKIWQDGNAEPTEWNLEKLDVDEPRLEGVAGRFGVIGDIAVLGRDIYFDDYTATGEIGVTNAAPTASFTAEPASGDAPLEVQFDAADSRDTDGSDPKLMHRYHWDFGDGSDPVTTLYPDIRHEFTQSGNYTVTLTVNDELGATASTTSTVTISSANLQVTEDWTGTDNDPWPSQWTEETISGTTPPLEIISNQGRVRGAGLNAGTALAYINNQNAEDVDQVAQIHITAGTGLKAGLIARRSDSDSDTYFIARTGQDYGGDGGSVRIYKIVDGTQTQLGYISDDLAGGTYMMRFRVETNSSGHTDLRLKVWQSGTSEPGTWNLEKLDVNEAKLNGVTGRFGLYANIGVSDPNRRIYFDDYQGTILDNITENWTGTDNDPWPSQWTEETISGTTPPLEIISNQGRVRGAGLNAGTALVYINTYNAEDVDQVAQIHITAGTGLKAGLIARRLRQRFRHLLHRSHRTGLRRRWWQRPHLQDR